MADRLRGDLESPACCLSKCRKSENKIRIGNVVTQHELLTVCVIHHNAFALCLSDRAAHKVSGLIVSLALAKLISLLAAAS